MTKKLQELTLDIEKLRYDILSYCQNNSKFQALDDRLREIAAIVKRGKLSLQLVGQNQQQVKKAVNLLLAQQTLTSFCDVFSIFSDSQSKLWSLDQTSFGAALRLVDSKNSFFELDKSQSYVIGRAENCNILVDDEYVLVSGQHGCIRYDEKSHQWLIKDISKNGTFMNGQRLKSHQEYSINSGDCIVLGSEEPAEHSLILFLDNPFVENSAINLADTFFDFDAVCFLFEFGKDLTKSEQEEIERFKSLAKIKTFGLIEINSFDFSDFKTTKVNTLLGEAKKKINISSSDLGFLDWDLKLNAFDQQKAPDTDHEFHKFLERLQRQLETKNETLLANRLEPQVKFIGNLAKVLIKNEQDFLSARIPGQVLLSRKQQEEKQIRLQAQQAAEIIKSRKDAFFGQVEGYLDQQEKMFMDELYANSLPCKLQAFSQELKPYVNKAKKRKVLKLQYASRVDLQLDVTEPSKESSDHRKAYKMLDANTAMLDFCNFELYKWMQKLWCEFSSSLAGGGIQNLYHEIFSALDSLPSDAPKNKSRKYEFLTSEIFSVSNFENLFTQVADEIMIKEPSAFAYLMKKIRSQWMQFIFLFSFFSILGIAGRRQIMRNIMAPIISLFNKAPVISSLGLICLIVFIIRLGLKIYKEDLQEERNKQANELRNKLCKHYQELTKKHLIKFSIQTLRGEIEKEKKRIEAIQAYLEGLHKEVVP